MRRTSVIVAALLSCPIANAADIVRHPVEGSSLAIAGAVEMPAEYAGSELEVRTISSRPEAISGGDVLVQVSAAPRSRWIAHLNGRDVTGLFRPAGSSASPMVLLTG